MSKTKTPLFSLGSQGSIGNTITTQALKGTTMVRSKPAPIDAYTLPQAYHRWHYQDWAYQWTQQSAATTAEYRAAGSPFHLTGFQYWMKTHLALFLGLVGWWKLDEKSGPIAYDSGPNSAHAVITGASPVDAVIDGGYYFDGLNDFINCGSLAIFELQELTLDAFIGGTLSNTGGIIHKYYINIRSSYVLRMRGGALQGYVLHTDGTSSTLTAAPITSGPGIFHHVAFTYDQTWQRLFIDGVEVAQDNIGPQVIPHSLSELSIGSSWYLGRAYAQAIIDNATIHDYALNSTQILMRSEKRYPP